jgi:hypothetical protein
MIVYVLTVVGSHRPPRVFEMEADAKKSVDLTHEGQARPVEWNFAGDLFGLAPDGRRYRISAVETQRDYIHL